jgi:hypothetical protein
MVAAPFYKVIRPMRILCSILALLLLVSCSQKNKGQTEPSVREATEAEVAPGKDGLARLVKSQELFTGVLKTTYQGGAPRAEIHFKEGKRHGPFKMLYADGSVKVEQQWKDNLQEGQHREFFASGKKLGEVNFSGGKPEGEQKEWYENGQLKSLMVFKDGVPQGVRREWDEKGVMEHHVIFKEGRPVSRELVANSSLTLSEKERKYLWDTEHHGSLLRKFGLGPLVEALQKRDSERISWHLAGDFEGQVPGEEAKVKHSVGEVLTADRWEKKTGTRRAVDRENFTLWLQELMSAFDRDPEAKISLMEFAPEVRYELEGLWRGNVKVRFWGESKKGGPLEIFVYLDVQVNKPTEGGLSTGGWLKAGESTRLKTTASTQYLMKDVAAAQGINVLELQDNWLMDPKKANHNTGGVFICDFNHDGVEDFLITDSHLRGGFKLYQGNAQGRFTDVGDKVGFNPKLAMIGGWMDLDGDGWEDLVTHTGQIFRNLKGEKFEEVTEKSNFMEVGKFKTSGGQPYHAVADYDGDGLLDVYLFRVDSQPLKGGWIDGKVGDDDRNQLLRNKGNWQFEDVTEATGTDGGLRSTFSSVWFDANNDNRPDLYVIHEYGNGVLLINNPNGAFEKRELAESAADFGSMGLASGDFDNDGNIDLYVASMYSKSGNRVIGNLKRDAYKPETMAKLKRMVAGSQLYRNQGGLKFEPVGKAYDVYGIGWAYAPTLTDLDNDGFLDLHATTGFMSRTRDKPDG